MGQRVGVGGVGGERGCAKTRSLRAGERVRQPGLLSSQAHSRGRGHLIRVEQRQPLLTSALGHREVQAGVGRQGAAVEGRAGRAVAEKVVEVSILHTS